MTSEHFDKSDIEKLQELLRGLLVRSQDDGYDDARRIYNAMHDKRPALIVRAAGIADVMTTVGFAGEQGLDLAVRGGGHSVPGFGTCDGGLVLDLGALKGIRVDLEARTVRAEGGCTWGDLNHATNAFGMGTTGGVVSTTGIAGLTLGGGMGYLARSCGLACDNLLSADVITADGRFLTCSEDSHPDLFWALRGGGGNFGVVTSFEYRLHPVGEIFGGVTFYRPEGEVLRNFADRVAEGPEELGTLVATALGLPVPFLPEEWHSKPVLALVSCWTGPKERDQEVADTLSGLGPVVGQNLWRMPYPVINTLFDELLPAGLQHYWKSNFAHDLPDQAIEAHIAHGAKTPSLESGGFIFPVNGACHRVAPEATAYGGRGADYSVVIAGAWQNAAENTANSQWVRDYYSALAPYSEEGGYINFMSHDDQDKAPRNYGAAYQRLRTIKAVYDPGNQFRLNQNIAPAV